MKITNLIMNMNLMNKLGRFVLSILGAVGMMCFIGCDVLEIPTTDQGNISVTLRLDEAFQEKANVRLNHNGTVEDFWYYMLTEDLQTDAKLLLEDYIEAALAADGRLTGNVGTNKNITFDGLVARTKYRALAAMISPDGKLASDVAELEFVTMRDPDVFEQWPAWSISYKQRLVAPNDPNKETEVFTCAVAEGDTLQTYIPCVLSKSDFVRYYGSDLRKCFEDYVDYRNSFHVKWMNEVKNTSIEYTQDRLMSGDYMLFMIGVDKQGELTGYYAKTELNLKQETASDAYKAWAGQWTLRGDCVNLTDDGKKRSLEYVIDIVPTENNLYYELYGYDAHTMESLVDIPATIPLKLYFEKSSGDIYVVSEVLPDIKDNQALADLYNFYAYGSVEVIYGGVLTIIPVDIENLMIARFSRTDATHAKGYNTPISIDLYGEAYDTEFVAFNYFYEALGLFNYILQSADYVLRTDSIKLTKN